MFRAWCLVIIALSIVVVFSHGFTWPELAESLFGNSLLYILPVWVIRAIYRRRQRAGDRM
jgi:hypothetical protein